MLTASQFAQQIIAQLRLNDPDVSAEIGTPERKIIDAVAQSLAANQIDMTGISAGLNINSKVGSNLDNFAAIFGMQRQQATAATGTVIFSRPSNSPAPADITVPIGTTIQSTQANVNAPVAIQYITKGIGTIPRGATSSAPVPVQCVIVGSAGNVAANTLTNIVGNNISGVTSVTNPSAINNGLDNETDDVFKTRFQNTWARNLAGTASQYLAIALAGATTTKANCIGNQSTYQEYIQVPESDDSSTYGNAGQWTTAMSDITYAKQIFSATPTFISNNNTSPTYFYREGTDYTFNLNPYLQGDALRDGPAPVPISGGQTLPSTTITATQPLNEYPTSGQIAVGVNGVESIVAYAGIDLESNTFTDCLLVTGVTGAITGSLIYAVPSGNLTPNWTFTTVYAGEDGPAGLQVLSPGEVVLSQFSYVSTASRNDLTHNIDNAVDIYVNGSNDVQASTVFIPNTQQNVFSINATSPFYIENFRRYGAPATRPQVGNYLTPLFQAPLTGLPATITVNGSIFYQGYHYWLVKEIGPLGGSIRARDGIEWNASLIGDTGSGPSADPLAPYIPLPGNTPNTITDFSISSGTPTPVEIDSYTYDGNIVTIQAAVEQAKQVTTDPLAHKAITRYFKFAVTLMYAPQQTAAVVNAAIQVALQAYLNNRYFGTVIQLSSILEAIASVPGVQNVRWSNDLPIPPTQIRVIETDIDGNSLAGVTMDRYVYGGSSSVEQQLLTITGNPSGIEGGIVDYFTLTWSDPALGIPVTTDPIYFFDTSTGASVTAEQIQATIQSAFPTVNPYANITVSENSWPNTDGTRRFTLTYGANGTPYLPSVTQRITKSLYTYDSDFFLLDDELPSLPNVAASGDTVPGLIIEVRAPNTWMRQPVNTAAPLGIVEVWGGAGTWGDETIWGSDSPYGPITGIWGGNYGTWGDTNNWGQ